MDWINIASKKIMEKERERTQKNSRMRRKRRRKSIEEDRYAGNEEKGAFERRMKQKIEISMFTELCQSFVKSIVQRDPIRAVS